MFKQQIFNKEVDEMAESITGVSSIFGGLATSEKTASSNDSIGKNDFLKLLTYQLREQNPLQPYNNQEFASQLAQFSQLEQLTDIKSLLQDQVTTNTALAETISNSALPGMLGKTAKAYTNKIAYDGENSLSIGFNLSYPAKSGELLIKDSSGKIVNSIKLSENQLSSGDHKLTWDGKDSSGKLLPSGDYSFYANVYDSNGKQFKADTFAYGTIEAVRFKSSGTMLVINGSEIPLQDIQDISSGN
jgi:flagellar basal-body rod modification protein FlgD